MRERERNLEFRRLKLHFFEDDDILMLRIPDAGSSAWTRLIGLKEIEKLNRYLDRIELAVALKRRKNP